MEYPSYTYQVHKLTTGSSLGNRNAFARFDAETNLRGLWCSLDNQFYAGEWDTEIIANGVLCKGVETRFYPESQSTRFAGPDLTAYKQCFIPYFTAGEADRRNGEMQALISIVRCVNSSRTEHIDVVVRHKIRFPAAESGLFTKQPPADQRDKRVAVTTKQTHCEITTIGSPAEARVFGSPAQWSSCAEDANANSIAAEYVIRLGPGEASENQYVLAFSPHGTAEAMKGYLLCGDARKLLRESIAEYKKVLSRSFIMTAVPIINRGLQWAKVNTVRVQHNYRIGEGFTNDPPQDILVVRDIAWYVLGSDYLTPKFSENLLALTERFAYHEGGKLTEYLHANEETPVRHDYKLNINDDTPLFVYALHHHALTGNGDVGKIYPLMKRACDWILSQLRDGLVTCDAQGTNVWGICGWRNIIDDYTLNGAVTEVNSECYHALTLTGEVARHLNLPDDERTYSAAAAQLKNAINTTLLSDRTGMYLLNRSADGVRHHDITGDLIFPVMFGVAEPPLREKILETLTNDAMWRPCGSRTVSPHEANYDPDFGYQLMGGLWHNLTAWIAWCVRRERPEKLVEGMMNIYRLCETDTPKDYHNVVPGEFPERLHGETSVSRGMAMSPWLPPTYLWLGVEGLLGVRATFEGLEMNPAIPASWGWVGIKQLPFRDTFVDAFLYHETLYANYAVQTTRPLKVGTSFETGSENDGIFHCGMTIDGKDILFVASDRDVSAIITARTRNQNFHASITLKAGESNLLEVAAMIAGEIPKPEMAL